MLLGVCPSNAKLSAVRVDNLDDDRAGPKSDLTLIATSCSVILTCTVAARADYPLPNVNLLTVLF